MMHDLVVAPALREGRFVRGPRSTVPAACSISVENVSTTLWGRETDEVVCRSWGNK